MRRCPRGTVRGVELGVVVGQPVEEPVAVESAQVAVFGELGEHAGEERLEVRGQREQAVALRHRDGPQLAAQS